MRHVVFVAPFPLETTLRFARALSGLTGIRLTGVWAEAPRGDDLRRFDDVVTVSDALSATKLTEAVALLAKRHGAPHRVVGILEPLQEPLAEVRARLGIPGADPATAERFRDKALMKDVLREHGLPCARHRRLTAPGDAEAFVAEVGLPIVMKPLAGMASKGTWRVSSEEELRRAVAVVQPSAAHPYLAEEFLSGREFSFETITIDGEVKFHSISHYYPGPLEVMENDWIQWVCLLPRDISGHEYDDARRLGEQVVKTLGLETGVTHMEWFQRANGSLAVGEIAARPPGANIVRMMGLAHDTDMYRAWARAVVDGAFDGPWQRRHAVACAFLRGMGRGRIKAVTGVAEAQRDLGPLVVEAKLPVVGAPKSDSYEGDGYVILRHSDTELVKRAATAIIETVRVHYE